MAAQPQLHPPMPANSPTMFPVDVTAPFLTHRYRSTLLESSEWLRHAACPLGSLSPLRICLTIVRQMRDLPKDSAALRSFNMNITEQLGVLHDRYLDLPRPYSQARILWEVGHDTVRVRDLRARFDLDSGYASRLLSALADDGVLRIEPDPHDGRGRVVTLTAAAGGNTTPSRRRRRTEPSGSSGHCRTVSAPNCWPRWAL